MGVTVGFSLHQFSEVLKIRDAAGQPYLLIGGQAVNYWAERYLVTEPQLEPLQPFTSEDIDFKGGVMLMSSASPGNWSWLRVIRPRCR